MSKRYEVQTYFESADRTEDIVDCRCFKYSTSISIKSALHFRLMTQTREVTHRVMYKTMDLGMLLCDRQNFSLCENRLTSIL